MDLANKDATIREKARVNLMGISRNDLDKLRELVKSSRPLAPSQVMALREIVDQVYQATEPYEPLEGAPGFLGVPLPPPAIVLEGADDDSPNGMLVASRIHGFCAARFLQDGDVITDIDGHAIRTSKDLAEIVRDTHGGDTIRVTVQRGGQSIEIPIKLDPRPSWAVLNPPGLTQDAIRERQRKADEYWDQTFAPLLDAGLL